MGKYRGTSLVELLACLALAALLLGLAAPSMNTLLLNARLANGLHGLSGSLAAARFTAIAQGVPVTVCPSADGRRCRTDLEWSEGWLLYRDPEGAPQPRDAEAILHHVDRPLRGVSVRSSAGRHRVRFQPTGMAGGGNVTLRLCAGRPPGLRGEVIVSLSGRARVQRHEAPGKSCPWAPAARAP